MAAYALDVNYNYECFVPIMQAMVDQMQTGKGAVRHGEDVPFMQQMTYKIVSECSGFAVGQMIKKGMESNRIYNIGAKIRELLGAVNYGMIEILYWTNELKNLPLEEDCYNSAGDN